MARSSFGKWPLLVGALVLLAACEEGAGLRPGAGTAPAASDVEAPDVFEASETGLWDGRPSLGGIWVAHPDVGTPRRVLVVNTTNGKETVGALFRRERNNPGPRIQISSDAASELGILAGQPTALRVVALEREEPAPDAGEVVPDTEMPIADDPANDPGESPIAPAADPVAAAAAAAIDAAVDASGALPDAVPVPEAAVPSSGGRSRPAEAEAAGAEAAGSDVAPEAAAVEPEPVPEDAPPTSFGRRRTPPPEAEAAGEAPVAPSGAPAEVSVAPLDGGSAAPAQPTGALSKPYVQAAVFSTEEAARNASAQLRNAGLTTVIRQTSSGSRTLWRLLVGPAATQADRDAMLRKVRAAGYADAYPVGG